MCLGTISRLDAVWERDGVRVGRLGDGSEVVLAFVPEAEVGDQLLVHLGIPVEVLPAAVAAEALRLRERDRSHDYGGAT